MLFKTKFEDKPPLGARPNLGHPILRHAQRYYPMLEGSGWAKDYRSGYSALRANNASSTWEPGRYINSTGNNACFRTDANDYTIPTTGYVYLSYWWRWNGVLPGTGQWSYHVYCNDYTRFSVYMGAIGSQTVWRPYSRNQPIDASVNLYSQLSDKQWHHFLWRLRFSSTISERVTHCWIDGTEYGPNTTGGSDVGGNTDMLAVNGRDDSTVRWSRGHMRDFILWYNTGTIPRLENEHLEILRTQPYFAFQRPLPIWINTVGGGAFTLTADAGSYAVTGTDATLKVGRKVAANTDAYAVTGTDATLKVGYKVAANTDAYTVTGTDATLKVGYKIAANTDAYTLTGQDASLLYGYTVTADAGSYTITGTDAGLKIGYKIAATTDAYTLTGQDVTLTYSAADKTLTADAGSYTVTGTDATLTAARKIAAAAGSYDILGTAAGLAVGRKIASAAGAITVTGTAATLTAARKIAAATASYTITGTDATLTYSGAVAPVTPANRKHIVAAETRSHSVAAESRTHVIQ